MNKQIYRTIDQIKKSWYMKIVLAVIIFYITIWLCDNLPFLLKKGINLFL
jgi:hypothetical protein